MDFRTAFQNVSGQSNPTYSPTSATNSSPHQQGLMGMQSPMSFNRSFQSSTLDRLLQPSTGVSGSNSDAQSMLGMDGSYGRPAHQQQKAQPHMTVRRDSSLGSDRAGFQMDLQAQIGGGDTGSNSALQKDDASGNTTAKRGSKACVACTLDGISPLV
jgi:hypothetical protein